MKRLFPVLFTFILSFSLVAQSGDWVNQMNDPSVNFYTVQQNFEDYWKERQIEKGKGWKQYKRWEAFMEPRVYPTGERPATNVMMSAVQAMAASTDNIGQWKPLGPFNGNALDGIGRINRIEFDPNNPSVIWAGAPAGGLWKSENGGLDWTTNTDQLANIGVSDVAIDPTNTSVMYLATGDRDGGDTYSFGVLKSIDGGDNWFATGLTHSISAQVKVADVYINPNNTSVLLASTSTGIYRSTDAGTSWTRVQIGSFSNMVQKPANSNVLFATSISSPRIYRSLDNGLTWNAIVSSALPSGGIRRIELAVTSDDSNYVYAVYGESTNNGFMALCRSTDGGNTWTQQATTPNLLGWQTNGNDVGGQAWYDLAIAVNPNDKDEVYVGGVNIWKSTNGGSSWNIATHWYGGGGNPFVHADVHHLNFHPTSGDLYAGTDGGIYRHKVGQFNWDELNNGINITQYYKMSASATDTTRMIAGAQDNGTHLQRSTGWSRVRGGDGMDCAINTKNPNIMYASLYYGDFVKSSNGGFSFNSSFNLPPSGTGNWVTPFLLDPQHPDTLYVGFNEIWKSYNGGVSFTSIASSAISGMTDIDVLGIAPRHSNVLFMGNGNRLYRSTDYGNSWTYLSTLGFTRAITGVAAAYDDPDHIVVTVSGYSTTEKVKVSKDGGITWTNISNGLPNLPVNCVVIEDNNEHSIYVGTDAGVYYRDDITNRWLRFNAGLPNVIVNDLEINYVNRKLRAGTYGRGVWETPVYSDLVKPVAKMNLDQNICVNDTTVFLETSEYHPSEFKWTISPNSFTFVGGTGDTSQNPQIVFSQKGFYAVSLTVSNSLGKDSVYESAAIAVGGYPLPFREDGSVETNFNKWSISDNQPWGWKREMVGSQEVVMTTLFNDTIKGTYEFVSPAIDFSGHDSVWLKFNHAYSGIVARADDSLQVWASSGCKDNWQLIATYGEDGSNNFRTSAAVNTSFSPGVNDWCTVSGLAPCNTVNLSAYAGQHGVRLKFVAISKGANNIYLDNILVEGNPVTPPSPGFSSRSSACALDTVVFHDQTFGSPHSWEWTFLGPDSHYSTQQNPEVSFSLPGSYSVKLKVINPVDSDSIIKLGYVHIAAADTVQMHLNYNSQFICATDTLSLNPITSNEGLNPDFTWYVNGKVVGNSVHSSFSLTDLKHGDTVYALLRSDLPCAFPKAVYSDTIFVNVFAPAVVSVSPVGPLCETDNPVPLSASPVGGTFGGAGIVGQTFDPSISGLGAHKVSYTYIDANGCVNVKDISVVVEAPPLVSVSNNFTICEGDAPKALNVATPIGGTYSGPGIVNNTIDPSVLGAGTHTINYTLNTGVCGIVSKSFSLTILPTDTPKVVVGSNQMMCDIIAQGYQWFDSNGAAVIGANSQIFSPSSSGQYRVDILGLNGCYASSGYASFSLGIEEIPENVHFNLFPNPVKESMYIEFTGPLADQQLSISIINAVGVEVLQSSFIYHTGDNALVDVSKLDAGLYTLVLKGSDVSISRKIILNK